MRPKSLVLLMLALGCGLVASIGISQVMDRRNQPVVAGETDAIFVAMQDISFGDPLSTQVLKLEQWPKDKIPPGAVSKLEDIEGRKAGTKLYAGEPVLEGKLMGSGDNSGPAIAIPKGYRVVSVQVDAVSSMHGLIKPGDRVDLLVFVSQNSGGGVNETATQTLLQDVKVFAVNEVWRRPEEKDEEAVAAKTVSLLVTPSQAEKVTLATEMGKVRLVMRSPDDDSSDDVGMGIKASEIFGQTAEKSERASEQVAMTDSAPTITQGSGILDWLKSQKAEEPAEQPVTVEAPVVPQIETFVMELLEGSALRTIEFQKPAAESGRWQNAEAHGDATTVELAPAEAAIKPASKGQTGTDGSAEPTSDPLIENM